MHGSRLWLILAGLMLGIFLSGTVRRSVRDQQRGRSATGRIVRGLSVLAVDVLHQLPIGALALAVTAVALGTALVVGSATCFVLITSTGGTVYPWSSPPIVALAIAAAILLIGLIAVEHRAVEPVLPLRLFSQPGIRNRLHYRVHRKLRDVRCDHLSTTVPAGSAESAQPNRDCSCSL
jgi:hypothetical protein